jgi:hypothetical protein
VAPAAEKITQGGMTQANRCFKFSQSFSVRYYDVSIPGRTQIGISLHSREPARTMAERQGAVNQIGCGSDERSVWECVPVEKDRFVDPLQDERRVFCNARQNLIRTAMEKNFLAKHAVERIFGMSNRLKGSTIAQRSKRMRCHLARSLGFARRDEIGERLKSNDPLCVCWQQLQSSDCR